MHRRNVFYAQESLRLFPDEEGTEKVLPSSIRRPTFIQTVPLAGVVFVPRNVANRAAEGKLKDKFSDSQRPMNWLNVRSLRH
jgi:hypothetical protein